MIKRQNIQFLILIVLVLVGFHYLLTSENASASLHSFSNFFRSNPEKDKFHQNILPSLPTSIKEPLANDVHQNVTRVKACFVVLVRNNDLHDLRWTMRQLEDRFNRKFNYPYVFLNDVEFTDEFKELTQAMTNAETSYGRIPKEHWSVPDYIDTERADKARAEMEEAQVLYGGSLPYRHMCRFESGFFFRHKLLDQYDYYWRVEPSVEFYCDIDYDPFRFMMENNMKYGWTISLLEYQATIVTLWDTVKDFMKKYPEHISKNNFMDLISNDNGENYNLCHFWSNFEIGDLNLWRSQAYSDFFQFLDDAGGFFYERWGDAPVHSIAAAILLDKDQIHWFRDIGYKHNPFVHCPEDMELQLKCHCDPEQNFGKLTVRYDLGFGFDERALCIDCNVSYFGCLGMI